MNPEIQKIIQDQLNTLPESVRDIIASIDVTKEIASIQTKHHLMLDQISTLEIETMLVMIGLEPADHFVENLKSNLSIDDEHAVLIANDINESIFQKIRHAMMEIDEEKEGSDENLDRDSILHEIENPTPTFGPKNVEEIKEIKDNLPEIAPVSAIQKYTAPTPTKNTVEQKLSEPTHTPLVEKEIFLKKLPQTPTSQSSETKKPAFDPYKEPLD